MYKELLTRYEARFPEEQAALQPLQELLAKHTDQAAGSRRHFDDGHITASGFALNPERGAVLLIQHGFLQKQLQPGGHLESTDTDPLAGVYRELAEEVGLDSDDLRYLPLEPQHPLVPLDIDIHAFPPRPQKDEPAHIHYDFRYLFVLKATTKLRLLAEEVSGARWIPLDAFARHSDFARPAAKITQLVAAPS